jgi:ribosomal protein L34E
MDDKLIGTCRDCGAMNAVTQEELATLTHAPHCTECGGPVELPMKLRPRWVRSAKRKERKK